MPSVHRVERTDRILVHSEASASPKVARRTAIGEVYAPSGPPGACWRGGCCW